MPLPKASAKPSDAAETARTLRKKSPLLPEDFRKLDAETKKRAFTVTDEVSLDAIRQMRDALAKAKADGIEYREFVKTVGPTLHAKWGIDSPQLKTVFVNNVQQAANQAIVARLNKQRPSLPYWTIDIVDDEVTSAYCSFFKTYPVVLPAGHPWWAKNAPMRHHRCRSTLRGLTAAEAKKIGISKTAPDWPPQDGWGGSAPMGAYKASDEKADITMATKKVKADLGPADVHVDRPIGKVAPAKKRSAKSLKKASVKPGLARPPRKFAFTFQRGGTRIEVKHLDAKGDDVILMRGDTALLPGVALDKTALLNELAATFYDAADGDAELPVAQWSPPRWNQLAKVGTFRGHPAGPFELTPAIFAEIVSNFRSTQNQRIPIDFEHASEQDPTAGAIPTDGAPAHGWILDLDNRGAGGLWGLTTFHPKAARYIRDDQYRYFSPAIRFGAKDRESAQPIGARMSSGALTNNPFLDGLRPMMATDKAADGEETITMGDYVYTAVEMMPKLRSGLFAPDSHAASHASMAECYDAVCRLERLVGEYRNVDADGDLMSAVHQGVPLGASLMRLRDMMGVSMGMTVLDMLALVKEMIEHAIGVHEEEMHTEELPPDSADMRNTTMADQETTVKLRDAENKVVALTNENATMTAKLRDAEANVVTLNDKMRTLETENARLMADAKTRSEQDEKVAIDAAFSTYKDIKRLSDADKGGWMQTLYRANRDQFNTTFPPVAADQRHLQRNLSERTNAAATTQATAGRVITMRDLNMIVAEYQRKGHSLEDAIAMAERDVAQAATATIT